MLNKFCHTYIEKLMEEACDAKDKSSGRSSEIESLYLVQFRARPREIQNYHDTITEFLDNYKFLQVDRKFILPTGFRAVRGNKAKEPTCGTFGGTRCPV